MPNINGNRQARQLIDVFHYEQRQSRAWLQYQVARPARGGIDYHAQRELAELFGLKAKPDLDTMLPVLARESTLAAG